MTLDTTLSLDRLGIPGGELTSFAEVYDSEVTDPLTGEVRRFNDSQLYYVNMEFRQDVPDTDWTWGIFAEKFNRLGPVASIEDRNRRFGPVAVFELRGTL